MSTLKTIVHSSSITVSVVSPFIEISDRATCILIETADAEKLCKFIMECKAEAEKKVQ